MINDSTEIIGNTAEFQVCYDLSKRGVRTARTPFDKSPYDVICEYRNKFVRIQVKGTSKAVIRRNTKNKYYQFNVTNLSVDAFDFLALVATDLETIHYLPVSDIINVGSSIMVPIRKMPQNEDSALIAFLTHN